MAKQTINIGAAPNDGTGTPLRTSFDYTNQNFTELYNALGGGVGLPGATNQVIFNNGTNLAGDGGLIYSSATDALTAGSFNPTASAIPTNGIYLPSSKNIGIAVDGVNVLNIDGIASRVTTTGSATITGDLTVRTNKLTVASTGVGINGTSAAYPLEINGGASASTSQFKSTGSSVIARFTDGTAETGYIGSGIALISGISRTDFGIASNGALVFGVSTGLGMTLNSTGLGVGGSPIASHFISAYGPICVTGTAGGTRTSYISNANTGSIYYTDGGASYPFDNFGNLIIQPRTSAARSVIIATGSTTPVERLIVDSTGNVGIGVTPITSHILSAAGPLAITGTFSGTRTSYITNSSAASIYYTDGGGSGYFTDFGNLIIQPRTSAARSVVIATGSTTPVERAVVKSTGQVRFVPLAADPSGAEAGDVYYNSTSNKLKCYNGTTWNDLF
jgi:hypothetical protein